MANQTSSLVLGFIGDKVIHRDNARALLEELISEWRRNNKGAKVRFLVGAEPFTTTLDELCDYCLNSDYELDIIGHDRTFASKAVRNYSEHVVEGRTELASDVSLSVGLVKKLASFPNARLILLSDPSEDDVAYLALEAAERSNIPVRSLLTGLDKVVIDDDQQKEQDEMARRSRDEEEELEEEEEFDEDDELDEDDLDAEEEIDEDDEDEDEDDEPEVDDDDDDDDDVDDELDEDDEEEDLDEEDGDEDDEEDLDDDDESDDEEPEDEEEEEMPARTRRPAKKVAAKSTPANTERWTESTLTRLAEKDRDSFYKVAAPYGVKPGRGMKVSIMVQRVLEAQGGKSAAPAKKSASAKAPAPRKSVAPAKKASATRPARTERSAKRRVAPVEEATAELIAAGPSFKDLLTSIGNAFLAAAEEA